MSKLYKINNLTYEIREVSQEYIRELLETYSKRNMEESPTKSRYMGITFSDMCVIYLDEEIPTDKKRKVLMHELMHAYLDCFLTNIDNFNQEAVCDISSNSHDIIHKIVEDYFEVVKDD